MILNDNKNKEFIKLSNLQEKPYKSLLKILNCIFNLHDNEFIDEMILYPTKFMHYTINNKNVLFQRYKISLIIVLIKILL